MTTTIAILGSCVSEDWYHHQDPRHRLDVKLKPRYQPSTLISTMAEPIDMPVDPGPALVEQEADGLKADFDKSFLTTLANVQPDVLIVELLYDSRRGVIALNGSWISSTYILRRSALPEEVKSLPDVSVLREPERYYEHFRDAAKRFGAFLRDKLPACKIILHQARWSEFFLDEDGVLTSYPPHEQLMYFRANQRLVTLERIFREEVPCASIRVDDIPIFADSRHIWGPAPDHYVKHYYAEFTEQLRKLIAADEPVE